MTVYLELADYLLIAERVLGLYGEEVEREGPNIDETVRRIAGTGGDAPSQP